MTACNVYACFLVHFITLVFLLGRLLVHNKDLLYSSSRSSRYLILGNSSTRDCHVIRILPLHQDFHKPNLVVLSR